MLEKLMLFYYLIIKAKSLHLEIHNHEIIKKCILFAFGKIIGS